MSRAECPLCREPLANGAAHAPVPELDGPGDVTVWFSVASGTHAPVCLGWVEDVRLSAVSLRRALRALPRRA
jgi:hypothetical protein